ncbi:hypothetical protein JCM19231_5135 [Vibrio ishigakensis]|uniref:Uncharacterized protein n=2 Tax=Vibrio ishigakensis TaxID=1481914 RepID=A0A0B8NW15_9VIBR|nr:hypothetical protein JCM19231_5135 [Vibrio ishigakensis]
MIVFVFIGLAMAYAVIMLGLIWVAIPKFQARKTHATKQ